MNEKIIKIIPTIIIITIDITSYYWWRIVHLLKIINILTLNLYLIYMFWTTEVDGFYLYSMHIKIDIIIVLCHWLFAYT